MILPDPPRLPPPNNSWLQGLLAFSTLVIFVHVVLVALAVPMPRRFRAISRGGRSQSSRGPSRSSRSRRGLRLSSRSRGRSRSNHGLSRSSCQRSQSRCGRSLSRRGLSLSMRSRGRGRSNRATRRSSRQRSQSSSSENIQRSRMSSTVEGRSQQSRRRSSRVEGPAEPKVQQQPAAPRRSSRVEGRPHLKVNDQELSVGDATKYFGEYGHVSAIWGNPKGGLPYTVAVRRDDIHKDRANLLLYVTIDPSIPISSDSDCKEFKNPPLPSLSIRKKARKLLAASCPPAGRGARVQLVEQVVLAWGHEGVHREPSGTRLEAQRGRHRLRHAQGGRSASAGDAADAGWGGQHDGGCRPGDARLIRKALAASGA